MWLDVAAALGRKKKNRTLFVFTDKLYYYYKGLPQNIHRIRIMQAPRARSVDRQSGGHALGEPRRPPARRSRSSALREVSRMGAEAPHGEAGRPCPRQPRQLPRLRPALGQRALPRIPRRAHRAAQPERPSPPLLLAQLRPLAHRLVVDPDSRLLRGRRPASGTGRPGGGRSLGGVWEA